jgi:EKC/KEOPS complex subunit PCC1/LAGE3
MADQQDWKLEDFPCTLFGLSLSHFIPLAHTTRTLHIPFPTPQLAHTAQLALSVDAELSSLVRRAFSLVSPNETSSTTSLKAEDVEQSILQVSYAATTNRMLRVAVNGFIESVGVVIGVMRDLDTDVVYEPVQEELEGVQGLDASKVG